MISMQEASKVLDQLVVQNKKIFRRSKPIADVGIRRAIDRISSNLFDGVMVVIDPKEHSIVQINDPYCVLSGGYGESVMEKNFSSLVPTSKRVMIQELFRKLFNARSKRPIVEVTIPIGVSETVSENLRARVYCSDSQICLLVDKSELARMQEIEVIRLKALISGSPTSGFWVTDKDGIIKDVVSPNCMINLGYDEKELVGMNIGTFTVKGEALKAVDNQEIPKSIFRRAKGGKKIETEVVQKVITMSTGEEYILHLDTYSTDALPD